MYRSKNPILILLAPGFDESDVTDLTCTLRGRGLPVMVVGLVAGPLRGAHGLALAPDATLSELEATQPQAIVLPGGPHGSRQLGGDPRVHALLRQVRGDGGYIAAIDSAYTVLRLAGLLDNTVPGGPPPQAPVWPASGRVIVEGPVIFGRDSGTAQETALTLAALLENRSAAVPML